ncbi:hypothetical protein B0H14DRAFT_2567887 [Mycena olivaceomarginata]|nr:hypothetical protein B0H14DRAFT_2567887 [Mycena olivaceomarginata]
MTTVVAPRAAASAHTHPAHSPPVFVARVPTKRAGRVQANGKRTHLPYIPRSIRLWRVPLSLVRRAAAAEIDVMDSDEGPTDIDRAAASTCGRTERKRRKDVVRKEMSTRRTKSIRRGVAGEWQLAGKREGDGVQNKQSTTAALLPNFHVRFCVLEFLGLLSVSLQFHCSHALPSMLGDSTEVIGFHFHGIRQSFLYTGSSTLSSVRTAPALIVTIIYFVSCFSFLWIITTLQSPFHPDDAKTFMLSFALCGLKLIKLLVPGTWYFFLPDGGLTIQWLNGLQALDALHTFPCIYRHGRMDDCQFPA